MGGIQSKPDPSRSMEVLGVGWSRTGTVSLQMALTKLLDGPVQHGATHSLSAGNAWDKAVVETLKAKLAGDKERTLKYLKQVMNGFVCCTDHPGFFLLPELMELYPDAKVVLTTRDPEKWWPSMEHVLNAGTALWAMTLTRIMPGLWYFPEYTRLYVALQDRTIGRTPENPVPYGPEMIIKHNQWVIDNVPKEKLLVMSVKDGWEPLCKFLGKPIPDEPFPRANDAESADEYAKQMFIKCVALWTGLFATIGVSLYMTWSLSRGQGIF